MFGCHVMELRSMKNLMENLSNIQLINNHTSITKNDHIRDGVKWFWKKGNLFAFSIAILFSFCDKLIFSFSPVLSSSPPRSLSLYLFAVNRSLFFSGTYWNPPRSPRFCLVLFCIFVFGCYRSLSTSIFSSVFFFIISVFFGVFPWILLLFTECTVSKGAFGKLLTKKIKLK